MATEKQRTALEDNTSEVPSDRDLFAGEVREQLSEREIFAGDEDLYRILADSAQTAAAQPRPAETGAGRVRSRPTIRIHKRLSRLQMFLVLGIVFTGTMLFYALMKSSSRPATPRVSPRAGQQLSHPELQPQGAARAVRQHTTEAEPLRAPTEALSLQIAETLYLQKDYEKAYAAYDRLRQSLPPGPEEELMRDFLQLKKAFCLVRTPETDQAGSLFREVLLSRSPAVRIVANYHLALLEMGNKQYLKARTRAYRTIGLIHVVDFDRDWALSLERNCHFLAAQLITLKVLSLCDADRDVPQQLWSASLEADPFTDISEAQLRSFLGSGLNQLSKALLGPQIQELTREGMASHWSVICHGASTAELLARFASRAGLDLHWSRGGGSNLWETEDSVRKRPVSLYLPAATAQQFVTVAAGCGGLLAQMDEEGAVTIFNPADYDALSEYVSLLSQEAVSLWQKFLLAFHGHERMPHAHFALGLLLAQRGQLGEAVAEYKLVANRFPQTAFAPFALLNSSRLKTNLRDYAGARENLQQLVEQYPDSALTDRACLYLADATMKAQLYDEAAQLYRKVYNLGLSSQSRAAAALGAGKCFYNRDDPQAAAKWLTCYIELAKSEPSKDLYSAYSILGKTFVALKNYQQACDAFKCALAGPLTREEYAETISALVQGYMRQAHFVEALNVLEEIRSWEFSQREAIEMLLLKSKVLRGTGLVDKAIAALHDRVEYIADPQLKAKVSFELAKCQIAKGNLEHARRSLTEILILVDHGPMAHEVACQLAEVCLELGQNSQAISVCSQLLDSGPSAPMKQRAFDVLATACSRQKNYDGAALALLGRWDRTMPTNRETGPVGTALGDERPLVEN